VEAASTRIPPAAPRRAAFALIAVATLVATVFSGAGPVGAAESCARNLSLNVAAHQDDDLLFMNPDIQQDIDSGRCVLTTFFSAGDAGQGSAYWQGREAGSRAAYAEMAGVPDEWDQRTVTIAGQALVYDELAGRPDIALIFLRLPDGDGGTGYPSTGNESLQKLWTGSITTIHSVDGNTSYTKAGLTNTLTEIMHTFQPDIIRTHDYIGTYGDGDHSDHHSTGYFVLAAHKRYFSTPHQASAYLAYSIANLAANLTDAERDRKLAAFLAYAPHDEKVCQTAEDCLAGGYGARFSRRYTSGSETGGRQNVARVGTITSSSQNTSTNQQATKAVDDWVAGSPIDSTREWATVGGKAGSWINIAWPTPHTLETVVLYDRPNANDRVTTGTLRFSDGSTVSVGALPNNGSALVVNFSRRRVTSLRFTVTGVASSTRNVGLAELQAYSANLAAQAFTSVSSQNVDTQQQGYKVSDGYATGSPAAPTREWATVGGKAGSWLRLTWNSPRTMSRVVLYDRPNGNDQITGGQLTFDGGDSVAVPALPNNGAGYTITFPARTASIMELTITSVSSTTRNVGLAEIQVEP
jgi:LmbE family N-acetylglucosaminyl deacetylase